jgi:dTDP-4-dehydrorhamnose reductase
VRVLVCGAGGMLGRDVVRAADAAGHDTIGLDSADLDVTDARAVARVIPQAAPERVVNCAAYTDVDAAEEEADLALRVNSDGARNVAGAAAEAGAAVLFLSTDYVFDGSKEGPYVESDEPRPRSSYGRSKLSGELETRAANPRHWIVRTSWLFGTGGRNFVETMLRAGRERDEVVVVEDQVGRPTYTRHLADGIVSLLEGDTYGLHHTAGGGEPCSWYEFALEIFRSADVDCRVRPGTTEKLARPAPRPANSVLASERDSGVALPPWRAGLEAYLAERRSGVR